MKINFINETEYDVTNYKTVIRKVLSKVERNVFFNIIFVTKDKILEINRNYRHIDRVTDVITFALYDNPTEVVFGMKEELGDVFICIDKAIEQANEYGHSVEREIGFLATHGYLHLKGYDHMNKEDEQIMFRLQDEILDKAKLYR